MVHTARPANSLSLLFSSTCADISSDETIAFHAIRGREENYSRGAAVSPSVSEAR